MELGGVISGSFEVGDYIAPGGSWHCVHQGVQREVRVPDFQNKVVKGIILRFPRERHAV